MVNSSPHVDASNVDAARQEQNGSRARISTFGATLPNTLEGEFHVPELVGASVRLLSVVRPNWYKNDERRLKANTLSKRVVESGFSDSPNSLLL